MTRPFQSTHIEYHILQSFPVTCLNRDDVGAPKSAVVGGVTRARVSSQCWKRQVRQELHNLGIKIAVRTVQVKARIAEACEELGALKEPSLLCGQAIADLLLEKKPNKQKKGGKKSKQEIEAEENENEEKEGAEKESKENKLLFFSSLEAKAFAEYAKSLDFDAAKIRGEGKNKDIAKIAKIAKDTLSPAQDGLDIALFGRMVAKASIMNIEASASFAHAISTHKASNEVEFFTALDDDLQEEPGSAHMGSLEFNSATYYRYISLDLGQLYANLFGNVPCDAERIKDTQNAVEAFSKALYLAVPTARQTTQSGASFWDYAHILVRKGQRLQASFDTPVLANKGYLAPSIEALESFLTKKEQEAGSLFQKQAEIKFGAGIEKSVDDILGFLKEKVAKAVS